MKTHKSIINSTIFLFIFLTLLMLSFRKIREYLPPPKIMDEKIVGYAQFFGYPMEFDRLFISFLVFSPFILFIYLRIFHSNGK